MRVFLPAFIVLLSLVCPPAMGRDYSDAEKADLAKVGAYLNSIRTLQSQFLQVDPDGRSELGTLYIEKPGHIRFAYSPPSAMLIVATGGAIYVKNARLNTVDHYDLSDTPLGLLLDDNVDLSRNQAVVSVREQEGSIIVQARTSARRSTSNITLVFTAPQIELRQWAVRDNQGGITTTALQGLHSGMALDPALFAVPVKNPPRPQTGGN